MKWYIKDRESMLINVRTRKICNDREAKAGNSNDRKTYTQGVKRNKDRLYKQYQNITKNKDNGKAKRNSNGK
jgi:hypothetical protein